jgi:hypothetical protein
MMFSSNICRFVACVLSLSLSATAETLRGVHRELQLEQTAVDLKTAGNYVILANTGISTITSSITGDIAVSPYAITSMTGFGLIADSVGKFSTSAQVTGKAYGADTIAEPVDVLVKATVDKVAAYNDAAGRDKAVGSRLNPRAFGAQSNPLTPGVYTFTPAVSISTDVYFQGSDTDIFIIQMGGTLDVASRVQVILAGGAKAENIFWQVAGAVTVGTGAHMEGIILGKTAVHFKTGSSLNGRILAQTACTLAKATINDP